MDRVVDQFTTAQASRITGFSTRQLDYWATSRLLTPSLNQSDGPGTRRLYSFDDLVKLHFIKQLQQERWSIQKIRKAIKHLDEFMEKKPEYRNFSLVYDKHTILILCETEERQQLLFDALNPKGQQVLWIILEILTGETRKNTDALLELHTSSKPVANVAA
ncbi:MAG: MerR family transcriptional regulator [Anaerolineae bacterium]|nr:MerR family transcriptional regulator [Anaerolineae bacterium]